MCLHIDTDVKQAPKKKIMWKIVSSSMRSSVFPTKRKYKIGKWFRSDRESRELTVNERLGLFVGNGIHVFTSRRVAREKHNFPERIIKVEVDPNDWVASGLCNEAVYMKVRPISIER